ncbi:protein YgfX [Rhodocyclus purpureus]|uniref:protein YgfX n=1 Tax=Rhodocyclus purpureus TaxID=1067 RepID=UPI00308436E9|nr:hypothetical protein [Rhodocyclus purpureus]
MPQPSIFLELRASRRLQLFLFVLHALAAGAVVASAWQAWAAAAPPAGTMQAAVACVLVLGALLLFSLYHGIRPSPVSALRLGARGGLAVRDRSGEWRDCLVRADSAVLPCVVILRLEEVPPVDGKEEGSRSRLRRRRVGTLVLPADALVDRRQFRALRVWLRWRGGASGAAPA